MNKKIHWYDVALHASYIFLFFINLWFSVNNPHHIFYGFFTGVWFIFSVTPNWNLTNFLVEKYKLYVGNSSKKD